MGVPGPGRTEERRSRPAARASGTAPTAPASAPTNPRGLGEEGHNTAQSVHYTPAALVLLLCNTRGTQQPYHNNMLLTRQQLLCLTVTCRSLQLNSSVIQYFPHAPEYMNDLDTKTEPEERQRCLRVTSDIQFSSLNSSSEVRLGGHSVCVPWPELYNQGRQE